MAIFNSYVCLPEGTYTHIYIYILIGGLEHEFYDFPYIGNVIPTDELRHFSEGYVYHQPVYIYIEIHMGTQVS